MTPEELAEKVPSLEELIFTSSLQHFDGKDSITTGPAWTFIVAPIKIRILSIALMWEYRNIPASDINYWRLTLQKGNSVTGWADVAQRSTQLTGALANGGIVSRKAWTFDAATWGDSVLLPGQAMRVSFAPFGSPPEILFPVCLTGRYSPQ